MERVNEQDGFEADELDGFKVVAGAGRVADESDRLADSISFWYGVSEDNPDRPTTPATQEQLELQAAEKAVVAKSATPAQRALAQKAERLLSVL